MARTARLAVTGYPHHLIQRGNNRQAIFVDQHDRLRYLGMLREVLREQGDKVSADEKAAVEGPLSDLKKTLEGNDVGAIKEATGKLMTASQAFSQKLYENAARDTNAAGTSASGQGTGSVNDDEIVDAEIVDDK